MESPTSEADRYFGTLQKISGTDFCGHPYPPDGAGAPKGCSMSANSTFHPRQTYKVVLFCLVLVPLCVASDCRYEETHTDSREFVSGGYIHVRLSVGDLHIKRGDSSKIQLRYPVKSRRESHVREAHIDFDVRGNDATVEFHAPGSGNTQFDVELEVPANTHLDVHQKVGDLSVENIEGDKDLS